MKAIMITGYGSPEVLKLGNVAKPEARPDELLVRIHAASITTADTMMRTGKPYVGRLAVGMLKPKHPIPGTGFAGVIEAVGDEVQHFKTGDRVFGETTLGFSTNAGYVTVPSSGVVLHMPGSMNFAEAATFCDGPLTSLNFLKEIGQIKPRQQVLINGSSGSLGTAAIQIAKNMGAEVTGVCSTPNVELVKSLGADRVIDYTNEDFTKAGKTYDIVFDTIGKSSYQKCKNILSHSGLYLSPVLKFSLLLQMMRTSAFNKKKAKFGATGLKSDDFLRGRLMELIEMYLAGKLTIVIDRKYTLEKVAEAHTYIASGRKKGNVVLVVEADDS
jgi:NADPH:quinone reductase-like Zn-dependent oxidoreductase